MKMLDDNRQPILAIQANVDRECRLDLLSGDDNSHRNGWSNLPCSTDRVKSDGLGKWVLHLPQMREWPKRS